MNQTVNQGWDAATHLTLKLQKAGENFCNAYSRLEGRERRKVMLLLERLAYRKAGTNSDYDRWTTDEMQACHLRLQRISQKIANCWRKWAVAHLKAGINNRLVVIVLVDALVCQKWIEESLADSR